MCADPSVSYSTDDYAETVSQVLSPEPSISLQPFLRSIEDNC